MPSWIPVLVTRGSLRTSLRDSECVHSFAVKFVTADGRVIERDMAVTMTRWNGQALPSLVVFGDKGSLPLVGAYTLEGFGVAPDPVNRKLVRVRGLAV